MIIGVDARHLAGKKRGIGYYIENLIEYMLKTFKDIQIVLFVHEDLGNEFQDLRMKIRVLKIPFYSKALSPFWFNLYLPFHLKEIDIFHCPNFFAPLFYKGKLVITVHDLAPLHFPEVFPKFYPVYFKNLLPISIKKAAAIITPTRSIKEEVEDFFPESKSKTFYVYHGIDEVFKPLKEKKIGLPYLLYVGALMKRKNIIRLLKAFYVLKERYKMPHYLMLVGKGGPGWREIKKEIYNHPYKNFIIHKGYIKRNKLVEIYQSADLFVFPSLYEGFGFPVLEAMKCGVPTIISNDNALVEITKGGAVVVNPLDYEEIAEKIHLVLTQKELREALIKKGLETSSKYIWKNSAFEVYRIYKRVLF